MRLILTLILTLVSSSTFAFGDGDWSYICSGFFVTDNGYIATAGHCIPSSNETLHVQYKDKDYVAKVVAFDKDRDAALIHIEATDTPFIYLDNTTNNDNEVYILGYPIPDQRGYNLKISAGYLLKDRGNDLLLSAGSCQGNSGGPVVNSSNHAIGILTFGFGTPCSGVAGATKIYILAEIAGNKGVKLFTNTQTNAIIFNKQEIYKQNLQSVVIVYGR
jgi:serine protease Do